MNNDERVKIIQEFQNSIPEDASFEDMVKRIAEIPDEEKRAVISMQYCDNIIDDTSYRFGWSYPADNRFMDDYLIAHVYKPLFRFTPEESRPYYTAVMSFYEGKTAECFEMLKDSIDEYIKTGGSLNESWFAYCYLVFKGSIPKLYDFIIERIRSEQYDKGLPELIKASKVYFCSTDLSKLEEAASEALLVLPDSVLAKELMAEVCWFNKHWHNTIALLECCEDGYLNAEHERMFRLAWCKSKIRDRKGAIEAYKKCLELNPLKLWARNNLAYEYYVTKQYEKAEKEYRRCLKDKMDLKYACTGYVRTLAALGKYDEADTFIKKSPEKIYKYALDELEAAKTGKKKYHAELTEMHEEAEESEIIAVDRKPAYQFSKEKIFEDELYERLSVGTAIFGIPLKIYRRAGIYGRQWTFEVGRIDLLAEDKDGNLYVIELKKDSGYDDAYAQTVRYVEWFEKSQYAKGKKVYGIICVNDPPHILVESVRKDKRIRLFEYHVSYTEII